MNEDDDTQSYERPWVGLTDQERDAIWYSQQYNGPQELLKALEQALKAKNT